MAEPGEEGSERVALVETPYGTARVGVLGSPRPGRPAILTFPDVGHTHESCFAPLFAHPEMQEIARGFLRLHLEAPGMEEGAPPYPSGYQYPSLEQLAEMIPYVLQHLNVRSVIGIGVGAGAFVLAKFGLSRPEAVEGLVLVNIDPQAKGWMDWAAHKLSGLTSSTTDLILGHLFTQEELAAAPPAVQQSRERLGGAPNVPLLWAMYNSRGDLGLERNGAVTLRCPVMLVVGDASPHEDAVVECNAKLDPTQTSFLKMADGGGQPQLSQPAKLTEAFKYFVQGMGYADDPQQPQERGGGGGGAPGHQRDGQSRGCPKHPKTPQKKGQPRDLEEVEKTPRGNLAKFQLIWESELNLRLDLEIWGPPNAPRVTSMTSLRAERIQRPWTSSS
ncbi:protein NDRG2 isoform X3 [Anas platyrhynchos]|uniref:protein NDRG2 isoform X3 n=1 Tax=Anas platyrhynchos TaxID=8839 RepID=UPI003AF2CBB9